MQITILGTCTSAYNIIDQAHIDAPRKRLFIDISDSEIDRLRIVWGKSYMPIKDNRRIIINIYGKKNYSDILDKYCKFTIKISKPSPQYKNKRFILKAVEPVF